VDRFDGMEDAIAILGSISAMSDWEIGDRSSDLSQPCSVFNAIGTLSIGEFFLIHISNLVRHMINRVGRLNISYLAVYGASIRPMRLALD